MSDVSNPEPFQYQFAIEKPRSRPRIWSSRGRIHNAIESGNEFVVRTVLGMGMDVEELDANGRTPLVHFFFFFGVYTPNQPKAMRRPRSLPFKGSVHPRENGLHKRPAFRAKEISKEIPLFRHHTHCRSVPNKSMPPPPRPLRPSPYIYEFFHHHAPTGPPLTKLFRKGN